MAELDKMQENKPPDSSEAWMDQVNSALWTVVNRHRDHGDANPYGERFPNDAFGTPTGQPGVVFLDPSRAFTEQIITISAKALDPDTERWVDITRTIPVEPCLKVPTSPGFEPGVAFKNQDEH